MQVNLKSLVMVGVVGLVAVGGSLFGFQEVRKAEARTACESVTKDADGKVEVSQANALRFDSCISGLKRLPFKTAEVHGLIEQSGKLSVLFHMSGAFVDGLKGSGINPSPDTVVPTSNPVASPIASPVPVPSPEPAPTPEHDFASLSPCDQLDAVAKAGKSVSDFVVADWSRFGAVAGTCPWHQSQIETARLILFPPAPAPANRGSGRSAEPDYVPERRTVVVERSVEREVPRYEPEPIPRYVPERRPVARVEGSCYHADHPNALARSTAIPMMVVAVMAAAIMALFLWCGNHG